MSGARLLLVALAGLVYGVLEDWFAITLFASCAIVVVVLAFVWSRVSLSGIAFSRRLASDRVQVGDVLQETILLENRQRSGSPMKAVAWYHSADPARGGPYFARFLNHLKRLDSANSP